MGNKLNSDNKSVVYYTDARAGSKNSLINKLEKLVNRSKLLNKIDKDERIAIKLHFGERGSLAYIRPPLVRKMAEMVKERGGIPFLTDTNTLYCHKRHNAIDHLETAAINGFTRETVDAPIIIADGLIGNDYETYEINGNYFKEIYIASAVYNADVVIAMTHLTGHPLTGFGGSIKNVSMGCSAMRGKYQLHSEYEPKVEEDLCRLCERCIEVCGYDAIRKGKKSIYFITDNCVGCGECVSVCPYGAIQSKLVQEERKLQEKMVEYVLGIREQKNGKIFYVNFLMDISPFCDCASWSDTPITPDIGILLSDDPVAVDRASVDLVNSSPSNPLSLMSKNSDSKDKFRTIYEKVDWTCQLEYGVKMGLGSQNYKLIEFK